MSQVVFLNEWSQPAGAPHPERCRAIIEGFLSMMLALRKVMPELALITLDPLPDIAIGNEGYTIRRSFLLSFYVSH